ncbi:MAG: universal stress protein [Candidatus Obscuribacterales bacterium]
MKILVPYDGSKFSLDALRLVATMALDPASEILIFNVAEGGAGGPLAIHEEKAIRRQEILVFKSAHLKELADELSLWQRECTINYRVHFGSPKESILDAAQEWKADLIVIAAHERSSWGRLIRGSVCQSVLDQAACSVLVVKPTDDVQGGSMGAHGYRVLIPIEGSFYSYETVSWIANQVWKRGTSFKLLMAVPEYKALLSDKLSQLEYNELNQRFLELKQRAFQMLEEHALKLGRQVGNEHVTIEVVPGEPRQVILDAEKQWQPDIITMGSQGHNHFEAFISGSVPKYVVSHCQCSCLIVRRFAGGKPKVKAKNRENIKDILESIHFTPAENEQRETMPHGVVF